MTITLEELNVAAVFYVSDVFTKMKTMIRTTDLLKILPNGIVIRADSCRLPMNQVKQTDRFTSATSCCMDYHSNCFQCVSLHFIHIVWMFAIKIVCMFLIKSRSVVYIR